MGKAEDIIEALGGADNIEEIEACATRLRTVVNDPSLVDEQALKTAGAFGVLSAGQSSKSSWVVRPTALPWISTTSSNKGESTWHCKSCPPCPAGSRT